MVIQALIKTTAAIVSESFIAEFEGIKDNRSHKGPENGSTLPLGPGEVTNSRLGRAPPMRRRYPKIAEATYSRKHSPHVNDYLLVYKLSVGQRSLKQINPQ